MCVSCKCEYDFECCYVDCLRRRDTVRRIHGEKTKKTKIEWAFRNGKHNTCTSIGQRENINWALFERHKNTRKMAPEPIHTPPSFET